jgi:hypothetical protein
MLGWTVLLAWGARRPFERRAILAPGFVTAWAVASRAGAADRDAV